MHAARPPLQVDPSSPSRPLFAHEALREDRVVTRLYAYAGSDRSVRVAAEVYPVHAPATSGAQWRFYDFSSREHAQRFADEALLALAYLGCTIAPASIPAADGGDATTQGRTAAAA